MTEYILTIDPGVSTGVALIGFEPDSAPELVAAWQFGGGVVGLLDWAEDILEGFYSEGTDWLFPDEMTVISEKFTARATSGFSYTTSSLEPLRGEGALIAKGLMPDYTSKEKRWRDPGLQYLVGGKDKADKKKRQHAFLKDIGFYRTGKDFGTPDADDFRSAVAHGLAYLAREVKHKETFRLLEDWISTKGVQ